MITLKQLLSTPIKGETILMFQRDGETLEAGGTVPSWKTFTLDPQGPGKPAAVVANYDSRFVEFDPETEVREVEIAGPYEGVTTYMILLNLPEEERVGPILWPRFKKHVAENPLPEESYGTARRRDLNEKVYDLRQNVSAKTIADVIMSAAMLAEFHGINVEKALWDRNRELLERMIATGSPMNPEKK